MMSSKLSQAGIMPLWSLLNHFSCASPGLSSQLHEKSWEEHFSASGKDFISVYEAACLKRLCPITLLTSPLPGHR